MDAAMFSASWGGKKRCRVSNAIGRRNTLSLLHSVCNRFQDSPGLQYISCYSYQRGCREERCYREIFCLFMFSLPRFLMEVDFFLKHDINVCTSRMQHVHNNDASVRRWMGRQRAVRESLCGDWTAYVQLRYLLGLPRGILSVVC